MSKNKTDSMNQYFGDEITACQLRRAELLADDRKDEANFEKIRENVFDIFRTMLSVAGKTAGDKNIAGIKAFFMQKVMQIPENWHTSYSKAEQHGDVEKMQHERIKLQAIGEIKAAFETIWGD